MLLLYEINKNKKMSDKDLEKGKKGGESQETKEEGFDAEVIETRENVRNKSNMVHKAPELRLPDNPNELDRLKVSIVEAVENGDIDTAVKLQTEKNNLEIKMAKNLRKAHDSARQRYVEGQKALSADERDRNWETRKKAIGEVAEGVGKGVWKLTKFFGRSGLFLGQKGIDLARYILKNTFGLARDIVTEIHNGIVDMAKHRRENLPSKNDI